MANFGNVLGAVGLGLQGLETARSLFSNGKKAEKRQQKAILGQMEQNYKYNEMSANAAHERTKELQDRQWGQMSHVNQVADWTEAGGNAAAYFNQGGPAGAGGSGGTGAQGGGAGGPGAVDLAGILGAVNDRRRLGIEGALAKAEIQKTKAETQSIKESAEQSRGMAPLQQELLKAGIEEKNITNGTLNERQAAEIAEIIARTTESEANTEVAETITRLNDAKINTMWQQLLNETLRIEIEGKNADTSRINALANQLSARAAWKNAETAERAEQDPGQITNLKTWLRAAENIAESISGEEGGFVGGVKKGVKGVIKNIGGK